jgi:hypothetical protein
VNLKVRETEYVKGHPWVSFNIEAAESRKLPVKVFTNKKSGHPDNRTIENNHIFTEAPGVLVSPAIWSCDDLTYRSTYLVRNAVRNVAKKA